MRACNDAANLEMGLANDAANLAMGPGNDAGASTDCVRQPGPKEVSTNSVRQARPQEVPCNGSGQRTSSVLTRLGNAASQLPLRGQPRRSALPQAVRPDHRKCLRTASVRQDARRARTPTKPQMDTITSGGILSGSSGEGSPPLLTPQLPLFL